MFLIKWCYDILFFNLGGAALMVLFHDRETSWPKWLPSADGVIMKREGMEISDGM